MNFSVTAGPGNAKADCSIISVLPVIHGWL